MATVSSRHVIWGIVTLSFVASLTAAPGGIFCNDANDCRVHCPGSHRGHCNSHRCRCEMETIYLCNDVSDCRALCPITHNGACSQGQCACDPVQGSFFCNDDNDCRIHCPLTHVGNCQNKGSNNQTCTCNYHPTVSCRGDHECRVHCPVTHRGRCKSDRTCSCDPIPSWLIPTTVAPAASTSGLATTVGNYNCLNNIDCEVHCPTSHSGACKQDKMCACDPHVSGKPISCHGTADCIRHCIGTHVGSCLSSSKTCRCLLESDHILG